MEINWPTNLKYVKKLILKKCENDICLFLKGTPDAPILSVWFFDGSF